MKKTFGIIGAGKIAQPIARHLSEVGYSVTISNSRGAESLKEIVANLGSGVKAATVVEAATSDVVILAVPWKSLSSLPSLTDWKGKYVIDATNHFVTYYPDFKLADLGDKTSSEVVQTYVAGAKVVKAFNTLTYKILEKNPQEGNGHRVLFLSGDDADFKNEVIEVIKSIGFAPIDLGSLAIGGRLQQAQGPLATINLIQL
jgi:8-hydroxy-5-deazaflavin:NADPH oxidoreductase